jgi:predicted transcriptional regulator YdeE
MGFRIVSQAQKWISGLELRTNNSEANITIPQHWATFLKNPPVIEDKKSHDIIALYCDYEGDHTKPYSLVIGNEVETPSPQTITKYVPPATYAVFTAQNQSEVSAVWNEIWHTPLCRTYTGDYELYREKNHQVEIYVAITPSGN